MRPGMSVLALYGSLHQLKRMQVYDDFCKRQSAVLFATDIAARGLGMKTTNNFMIYFHVSYNSHIFSSVFYLFL
jgi:superfamily II DNA/RNA helicase